MIRKKIRVLIVDDSLFFQTSLKNALSKDPSIEVIGCAIDSAEAFKKITELKPDVITSDQEMPGLSGTDFIKKLMSTNPVPVILVSTLNIGVFQSLKAGAVDFVQKPSSASKDSFETFSTELSTKIKIASIARLKSNITPIVQHVASDKHSIIKALPQDSLIAIGASTGGTEAILKVVQDLPVNCPGVVMVQHMPVGFTKMFAERLDKSSLISVKEATDGDRVEPGRALLAPGDKHMTVHKDLKGYYVRCKEGEKVSGHCPSVDVLFSSVAMLKSTNTVGVILTGMGHDGSDGMLEMRKAGSYNIGQQKDSCVVYGMPKEAYNKGGVNIELAVENIPSEICKYYNK